jgi:hypothetical protein
MTTLLQMLAAALLLCSSPAADESPSLVMTGLLAVPHTSIGDCLKARPNPQPAVQRFA